jgi:chloride channel 3/4/5
LLAPTDSHHHSRTSSIGSRIFHAFHDHGDPLAESKGSIFPDDRVWYDQFTSTDWVHDNIADAHRLKALRSRKDLRGRIAAFFDASQGWVLSALCGVIIALIAYVVDVSEVTIFDYKDGYCTRGWYLSEKVRLFEEVLPVAKG